MLLGWGQRGHAYLLRLPTCTGDLCLTSLRKAWRDSKGGLSRICGSSLCRGGEGNGNPLQYSCLENPMDGGAWWATVHGVDFTFTFHFHVLEKEMATHSSVLALRIPGPAEPGGLPCLGSNRVGHD